MALQKNLFGVVMILLATTSTPLRAQSMVWTVTLSSDPIVTSCTLVDNQEGPLKVYVINEIAADGLVSSSFRVASSAGFSADYMGETIHLPFHIGDLRTGIDITYAYCATATVLLATMEYMGHGTSSPCAYLEVLPHPDSFSGSIEVMDCAFDTLRGGTLGPLLVNPLSSQCAPWCVVSVQSSTWGAVKALYR
jgi:hypothetical protein